jgi:DNA-binding CsgD family transcriptional regulator
LCDYHERAGVAVPAEHFIGKEAFCSGCFRGKSLFPRQKQQPSAQPGPRPGRAAPPTPAAVERITSRVERIQVKTKAIPFVATRRRNPRPRQGARLSPRESEILELLAESLDAEEIATTLGISGRTVKFHIGNALAKSGKSDRCSLVTWFAKKGAPPKEEIELRSLLRSSVARIEAEFATLRGLIAHIMGRDLYGGTGAVSEAQPRGPIAENEDLPVNWPAPSTHAL